MVGTKVIIKQRAKSLATALHHGGEEGEEYVQFAW